MERAVWGGKATGGRLEPGVRKTQGRPADMRFGT